MATDIHYPYHPGRSMGHPSQTAMCDAAESVDTRVQTNALEQIAFELRTANLLAFVNYYGSATSVTDEIRMRLGIATPEWET